MSKILNESILNKGTVTFSYQELDEYLEKEVAKKAHNLAIENQLDFIRIVLQESSRLPGRSIEDLLREQETILKAKLQASNSKRNNED